MSEELLMLGDEALVQRARGGDDGAIETLLERYRHYARAKARTYFLAGGDKEDIVQEGMIGLFKAIRDFDPKHETAFRAFAELCITRQIISAIKSAARQKHRPLNSYVSLSKPAHEASDDRRPLEESLAERGISDPAELVISAEEVVRIKQTMGRVLSDLELEVLRLYLEGNSYQQIAGVLGRHGKSIDNALQRIKRKLEQHIAAQAAAPGTHFPT